MASRFPHELLSVGQVEDWTSLHEAALYRCRALPRDLCVTSVASAAKQNWVFVKLDGTGTKGYCRWSAPVLKKAW